MCGSPSDRRPGAWRVIAAIGIPVAVAGCIAAVRLATGATGFDHAAHAERGISCTDCHAGAKASARAGMPEPSACGDCHDPAADGPEITGVVRAYAAAPAMTYPSAAVRGATYADVKFDHAKHAGASIDCARCHDGATRGALPNPSGPLAMSACVDCHTERGAKTDCTTCHAVTGKDGPPRNHEAGWRRAHGPISRMPDRRAAAERCDLCHARADCDACHTADPPRDHTNAWRVATHGLAASMDRSRCLACHQADSCDRCHQTEPPRSHRAGFGGPRQGHCLSCHDAAGGEGCAVCHKGTSSHVFAKPKPLGHTPSMQCRSCHGGGGEALPHVDGGMDCNVCHQ